MQKRILSFFLAVVMVLGMLPGTALTSFAAGDAANVASVTSGDNPPTYSVTVDDSSITNGTVTVNPTTAAEGETVTLTVTPADGYALESLTVKGASDTDVPVTNNTFTMPASNVTVTAVFAEPPVASVTTSAGTTNYTDIGEAVVAAQANSGSTLTLLADITTTAMTTIDRGSFTIDLNGKTWQRSSYLVSVRGDADIKIIDNSTEGTGKLLCTGAADTIMLCVNAKLEIAGGTVENNGGTNAIAMYEGGNPSQATLIVSGGKVVTKGVTAIFAFGQSVTVTGGTIECSDRVIYYMTGKIDLSGHSDPTGITIHNGTGAEVTPGEDTIKLPAGYVMLDESGNVAATLAVYQTYTVGVPHSVSISAVDIADGEGIEGAAMQILKGNTLVAEWVSEADVESTTDIDESIHEIFGLKTGEEYTLRCTAAPDGYTIPADTKFAIDENGNITTTGSVTTDGVLLAVFTEVLSEITSVTFDTDSEAYDSATNTFYYDGDHPLVVTIKGRNLNGQVLYIGVCNSQDYMIPSQYVVSDDNTADISVEFEASYLNQVLDAFAEYDLTADIVGIFVSADPSWKYLNLNVLPKTYTVTFVDHDGSTLKTETVKYGRAATAPADPAREGYTFTGWDNAFDNVTGNLTVKAEYTINQYTITFNTDGGTAVDPITQDYNTAVTAPANPTKTGYTFKGWDQEIPATMPAENMTIKATWEKNVYDAEVTQPEGGKVETDNDNPTMGDKVTITVTPDIGKEVDKLTVTDENGEPVAVTDNGDGIYTYEQPAGDVTIDVTMKAKKFLVTWSNGDGGAYEQSVAYGSTITVPNNEVFNDTMRKAGYTQTGWDQEIPATMPAQALTFTAQYTANTYTVSFDTNGGAAIDPITVTYGEKYGRLPSSAVDGLSGGDSNWYLVDENGVVTESKITRFSAVEIVRDHTLRVQRKILAPTLKITLQVPGAISDGYQYYVPGNSTRILTVEINNRNDDVLVYSYQWYKDGALLDGETESVLTLEGNVSDSGTYRVVVTAVLKDGVNIQLTNGSASSEKEQKVKILHAANTLAYDGNGGGTVPGNHYTGGAAITVAAGIPERFGYTFAGWCDNADGTGTLYAAGDTYTFAEDNGNGGCVVTMYAQWTANVYGVTLNTDGGTIRSGDVTEYTCGVGATLPTDIVKSGYTFAGWYDNADFAGEAVTEITAEDYGDKEFFAKWKMIIIVRIPDDPVEDCQQGDNCPAAGFTDLDLSMWYHDGIHFCVEESLMNGTSATTFEPATTTSRAMIVTLLYRLAGSPAVDAENPFTDVEEDMWYTDAVIWAAENGIVDGYGNGKFGQNDAITREQTAKILCSYAVFAGKDVSVSADVVLAGFGDADTVSAWAKDAMLWAVDCGLINGKTGNLLDPKGEASRAEAATMLYRFCEFMK